MRVALNDGAYQARSIIAEAQRCINLYAEQNPKDAPVPYTYYPTPGLTLLAAPPVNGPARCCYRSTAGFLYYVVGPNVYSVSSSWVFTLLGTMVSNSGQVSMNDNGMAIILVDGSTTGYAINMANNAFGSITDPNFLGGIKVEYLDTFFLLNRPRTNQFYCSLSNVSYGMLTSPKGAVLTGTLTSVGAGYAPGSYLAVSFTGGTGSGAKANIDITPTGTIGVNSGAFQISAGGTGYSVGDVLAIPTLGGSGSGGSFTVATIGGAAFLGIDIAAKVGSADFISSMTIIHQEIWLVGTLTTEVWYNAGSAPFPFQQMPQGFIEHGLGAVQTLCSQDTAAYWLAQDRQGQAIVLRGSGYLAERISTHAIEAAIAGYTYIDDATGFIYQQEGHTYYFLTFPNADVTWVYDEATKEWHQRAWTDLNGILHRHRANCGANAYGMNVCGDWQNGNLYKFDLNNYTDNTQPITRIRSFPHLIDDGNRVVYTRFIADMDVGNDAGLDGSTSSRPPVVLLRFSDDKGASYSNPLEQSLGAGGQYNTSIQFRRLGLARDRVFELSWSMAAKTALNGAFVEFEKAGT